MSLYNNEKIIFKRSIHYTRRKSKESMEERVNACKRIIIKQKERMGNVYKRERALTRGATNERRVN